MDKIKLYEEYRLIERGEMEINGAWRGAHLLLFFLAFVFGCSCTFSFHILMYLFDEKCVLFPKLLSLKEMRQSVIYDFMPVKNDDSLPVDFVSTQWTDTSTCYLPTYVPLVSGIFGLVWTTMLLMCSSGNRTLTGLQRPWRILPPVFVFSIAMGSLSVYTSFVTHAGLQDLCEKLSEVTGSKTCAYSVNIVTLVYERRIRGVYQATRLTILTAWMHTSCWLIAAAVALARVLLVVDFRLVRIQAELQGNIENMLERHERHIRTVSPDITKDDSINRRKFTTATGTVTSAQKLKKDDKSTGSDETSRPQTQVHPHKKTLSHSARRRGSAESIKVRFVNKMFDLADSETRIEEIDELHYISQRRPPRSKPNLVPDEALKLAILRAYRSVSRDHRFIVKIVFDLLDKIEYSSTEFESTVESTMSLLSGMDSVSRLTRQHGKISSMVVGPESKRPSRDTISTITIRIESGSMNLPTLAVQEPSQESTKREPTPLVVDDVLKQLMAIATDSQKDENASTSKQKSDEVTTLKQKAPDEVLTASRDDIVTPQLKKEFEETSVPPPFIPTELPRPSKQMQTKRPTGAIVIPRTKSKSKPTPKVTQSARLATKSSSRKMPKKTRAGLGAKEILEHAIKDSYYRMLELKEIEIQTEESARAGPITLRADSSDDIVSEMSAASEKTLTPMNEEVLQEVAYAADDEEVSPTEDRKPKQSGGRDEREPGSSTSREANNKETQTPKKEKQD